MKIPGKIRHITPLILVYFLVVSFFSPGIVMCYNLSNDHIGFEFAYTRCCMKYSGIVPDEQSQLVPFSHSFVTTLDDCRDSEIVSEMAGVRPQDLKTPKPAPVFTSISMADALLPGVRSLGASFIKEYTAIPSLFLTSISTTVLLN